MFNWTNPKEPVVVKLPSEIYWGVTGPVTVLSIIGIAVMNPKVFCAIVGHLPNEKVRKRLERTWLYDECNKKAEKNAKGSEKTYDDDEEEEDGTANGSCGRTGNEGQGKSGGATNNNGCTQPPTLSSGGDYLV